MGRAGRSADKPNTEQLRRNTGHLELRAIFTEIAIRDELVDAAILVIDQKVCSIKYTVLPFFAIFYRQFRLMDSGFWYLIVKGFTWSFFVTIFV